MTHKTGLMNPPPNESSPVLDELILNLNAGRLGPFWLMLMIATGIASLGFSENSAVSVIGAMIVAPLGQPIITLGATIALGWPSQTRRLQIYDGHFTTRAEAHERPPGSRAL